MSRAYAGGGSERNRQSAIISAYQLADGLASHRARRSWSATSACPRSWFRHVFDFPPDSGPGVANDEAPLFQLPPEAQCRARFSDPRARDSRDFSDRRVLPLLSRDTSRSKPSETSSRIALGYRFLANRSRAARSKRPNCSPRDARLASTIVPSVSRLKSPRRDAKGSKERGGATRRRSIPQARNDLIRGTDTSGRRKTVCGSAEDPDRSDASRSIVPGGRSRATTGSPIASRFFEISARARSRARLGP